MRTNQLEARVYEILDRVTRKQPIEDDSVELKTLWIEPQKAARRLAGHANAALGEPILWLMGVDERAGTVPGVNPGEFSNWSNQIKSQFDEGISPELLRHVNVPHEGVTVVALYFETDRSPYVVKNPAGGAITFDVPWRQGTMTYSAKRAQLLRLLAPVQKLPDLEILRAYLVLQQNDTRQPGALKWEHYVEWYISPRDQERAVFPLHRCRFLLEVPDILPSTEFTTAQFVGVPGPWVGGTEKELVVSGPGRVETRCYGFTDGLPAGYQGPIKTSIELCTLNSDRPAKADATLPYYGPRPGGIRWHMGEWTDL